MYRIEYQVPTMNGRYANHVMFVDDYEELDNICSLCDKYDYQIVDISNYVEEV